MNAELEYYFEQELRHLRESLVRYATRHPEAAAKLQIGPKGEAYADVERIVHGAALLNARTACKIEDGHSQIIEGFLNVLYPHYLRPLPSVGIVQVLPDPANTPPEVLLQKSNMRLVAGKQDDLATFTLPADFRMLPIEVTGTKLSGPPFNTKPSYVPERQRISALQFEIRSVSSKIPLSAIPFHGNLRLFISEDRSDTFELYEFLLAHATGITFTLPDQTTPFAELPPSSLSSVGLQPDQDRLLDLPPRSFPGFGLLTELFSYPSRFNFIDLAIPDLTQTDATTAINVHVFLSEQSERLEGLVNQRWLRPNCTPIINLFEPACGALVENFDPSTHEIPLVVESLTENSSGIEFLSDRFEIYSVDEVELVDCGKQTTTNLFPLYSVPTGASENIQGDYYWTRREFIVAPGGAVTGSDVFLQTSPRMDIDLEAVQHLQYRVKVKAMNRNVPLQGDVQVRLAESVKGISKLIAVQPFSPAIRPYQVSRELWRIVNQLSSNSVTLLTTETLRNLIELYQVYETKRSSLAAKLKRSIQRVHSHPIMERIVVAGRPAFVRGTHLEIEIDSSELPSGRAYLLGSVLGAFLCHAQSINSFTRVSLVESGRVLGTWISQGQSSNL